MNRVVRLVSGVVVAAVFAGALVVVTNYGINEALCAGLTKESPEWYLFGCYFLDHAAESHRRVGN